jgi:hypothetical protein
MKELFDFLVKNQITPNQWFVLYCRAKKVDYGSYLSVYPELTALRFQGFLTEANPPELTDKGRSVIVESISFFDKQPSDLSGKTFEAQIEVFRAMFPDRRNGTTPYRTSVKELTPRFQWFFRNYHYNWDQILLATQHYLLDVNPMYMRTAKYFIKKQYVDKNITSDLANYCSCLEADSDEQQVKSTLDNNQLF